MAGTKKVRIIKRVGDPRGGVILAPGATADLPEVWANKFIASGHAEAVVKEKTNGLPAKKSKGHAAR